MKILILREDNIEYIAKRTGQAMADLELKLREARAENRLVYIHIGTPWS